MVDCPNCQRKLDLDLLALPAGAVSLQCFNCGEVMEHERVKASAIRSQMANELIVWAPPFVVDPVRWSATRSQMAMANELIAPLAVMRQIRELIESATIDGRADEVCSIPFEGKLLAKFAELPKDVMIVIEQFMVRSLARHCAARLRCSTGDLVMEVAGSWDSADYVFTVKRRKKEPPAHMVEWCRTNGYTDWAYEDGCWRAFPPNSVMPVPVPRVAFIGSSQPVYGRSLMEQLLGQQCDCMSCQGLRAGYGVGQL